MSNEIVRFSRLLRIFKLNGNPAFIIEMEENNQKTLYISYHKTDKDLQVFESYNKTHSKEEFENLSTHCLMSQCTDATGMFENSHLTHFETDCSSLVYGFSMFSDSKLNSIKTEFPSLENGDWMFFETKIKEININFLKLKNGYSMFADSSLEKINSQFPLLESGSWMFEKTLLKEINCHFPKLKKKKEMFSGTPDELKQNYPHYFA